jgi:hypothetical protein
MATNRFGLAAIASLTAITLAACTHAFQTSSDTLPGRMRVGEFSFDRPQSEGWYLKNTSDPPTIVEFTKRGHRAEAQILIRGYRPENRIGNPDELVAWAESLPDAEKYVTLAPGHGATCVRFHGRSALMYGELASTSPIVSRITTDQDSLNCIDPTYPGMIVRFIVTQRGPDGGTPDGSAEAYAFLKSVQFESRP